MIDLRNGDCIEQMRQLPPNSVDSIVTDPPYELGFMGKSWDSSGIAYSVKMWDEALRVLKPGGHLLAFSGSRTYHRMAVAIEDAGFEIRDQIMWVYGSGFPKSLDVSKAIDKQAGVEREVVGSVKTNVGMQGGNFTAGSQTGSVNVTAPTTDKAKQWEGWGTALKPAHEPIVLARKPLIGTVATNVIIHGTGALNIDGSRIGTLDNLNGGAYSDNREKSTNEVYGEYNRLNPEQFIAPSGRWPANFIHDGLDEDWARFFYCAKASKKDRNEGLDDFAGKEVGTKGNGLARTCASCGASTLQGCECPDRTYVNPTRANHHPTVKPTELMRYLVRMITPPNGTVLDPFMGSGSTGKAAVLERFRFIGIDQSADYLEIATARIKHAQQQIEGQLL
jgi:site-specific DNA-methyltransferase (adenine-specific)